MSDTEPITAHYSLGGLRERIETALKHTEGKPSVKGLGPVDEFHIGGRAATSHLIGQIDLAEVQTVLDIGCGIGGTARLLASTVGAQVSGIDLTPEYIEVATWLSELVGLGDRVAFHCGSALSLPFDNDGFDLATMLHVGMNIADKGQLCREVERVLRPAGTFAIYDIMRAGDGELAYPVPWAAGRDTDEVTSPAIYVDALEKSGFEIVAVDDRTEAALTFIDRMATAASSAARPPPLGLHLVMGPDTGTKVANMIANVRNGLITPTEIIARLAS